MNKKSFVIFIISLCIFAAISVFINSRSFIDNNGDAISYVDAMNIIIGLPFPPTQVAVDFALHRILTTFLGLESIIFLSFILGKVTVAWTVFEIIFYFIVSITTFKLLEKMFNSSKTALMGSSFFAFNYAMLTGGLGYFMDIGGWTFYMLSVYSLYKYIENSNRRDLWLAALFISVGGFFKENAFFAYIPFVAVIFYESFRSPKLILKNLVIPSLAIAIPAIIHHINIYIAYHHAYILWVRINQTSYFYASRIVEYIKSFGSLLNFLIPVSLAGFVILLISLKNKNYEIFEFSTKKIIFIFSILISSIPAIMWPGITQRVLFMVVPGAVIFASFFIKKYEKYWYFWLVLILLYALSSIFMDSFILKAVNLPF